MEPLEAKEIDKVARKDKSFLATYSVVEEKWNHIHTAEDSARWRNITYNRLHQYLATIESSQLNSPLVIQLREKWEKMYNSHLSVADTIIRHWKHYLNSNSADSLVTIEYEGVEFEMFRNSTKQIDTLLKAKISISPLRHAIDSIFIQYSFVTGNENPSLSDTSSFSDIIAIKRKIDRIHKVKVFLNLNNDLKRKLMKNDSSVIFTYSVNDLYLEGKSFNSDSLMKVMPESVQDYLCAESKIDTLSPVFDHKFYMENIIKELVDNHFMSQSAYIKLNAEDYYKEIDSLVYSFLNYNGLQ